MNEDSDIESVAQEAGMNLFVYGTLRDGDVRKIVLGGEDLPPEILAGFLKGYRVMQIDARFHPELEPDANGRTEGLLLRGLSAAAMDRLAYFASCSSCDLRQVTIATSGGEQVAVCFFPETAAPQTDGPWDFERWQQTGKQVFLNICAEIMQAYGEAGPWDRASFMKGVSGRVLARADARATSPVCALRSGLGRSDVRAVSANMPYNGFFAIEEHWLSHRRFDGSWTPDILRAVFVSADAAVVLPYDPRRDTVLLVEQFRPGPFARGDANPWCLEVVAGRRDQNETFEQTARREAREEAGLELRRLEQIGRYYSSPGAVAEYLTGFIGEADLPGGGGFHGLASENEDIRTIVVSRVAAMAAVTSGEINNAHTILPLMYLELHHRRLRELWREGAAKPG